MKYFNASSVLVKEISLCHVLFEKTSGDAVIRKLTKVGIMSVILGFSVGCGRDSANVAAESQQVISTTSADLMKVYDAAVADSKFASHIASESVKSWQSLVRDVPSGAFKIDGYLVSLSGVRTKDLNSGIQRMQAKYGTLKNYWRAIGFNSDQTLSIQDLHEAVKVLHNLNAVVTNKNENSSALQNRKAAVALQHLQMVAFAANFLNEVKQDRSLGLLVNDSSQKSHYPSKTTTPIGALVNKENCTITCGAVSVTPEERAELEADRKEIAAAQELAPLIAAQSALNPPQEAAQSIIMPEVEKNCTITCGAVAVTPEDRAELDQDRADILQAQKIAQRKQK